MNTVAKGVFETPTFVDETEEGYFSLEITYFIDAGKQIFKNGTIDAKQLANLAIVGIGHEFVGS